MDKLKKYAGYTRLGFVGWLLSGFIVDILLIGSFLKPSACGLCCLLGFLGGVITKKWWGALVGGILPVFILFFALLAWSRSMG